MRAHICTHQHTKIWACMQVQSMFRVCVCVCVCCVCVLVCVCVVCVCVYAGVRQRYRVGAMFRCVNPLRY